MRNRAKCKLCKDVVESFLKEDYVECGCGEIAVDGGEYAFKAYAKHWENFIRIDDDACEILPKVIDKEEIEVKEENEKCLSKSEMIDMLKEMVKSIEKLPDQAMTLPINHYDFYNALSLITAILKAY